MHLFQSLVEHVEARRQGGRRPVPSRRRAEKSPKVRLEEADHPTMVSIPGRRDGDLFRTILLSEVCEDGLPAEPLNGLATSQDGAPKRMGRPDPLGKEVVDQVIWSILHHLDLLEDHRFLSLNVFSSEERMEENVREEIHRQREVLVEHAHVKAGVLLGGKGIHVSAHRIHGAGNLLGGAGCRPFKNQVLDEVGDPAAALRFVARPGVDPNSHRD